MATESLPKIELPFVYRPRSVRGEWYSLVALCSFSTLAVVVVGLVAVITLANAGHWFRLLVPTLMLLVWWLVTWLLVANYRRSVSSWRVDYDHVERTFDEVPTLVEFDEVTCLRVRPKAAILEAPGQPTLKLPKHAARALAHSHLIDYMVGQIEPTIRSEGAWTVRPRPWIGGLYIAGGLGLVAVSFSSIFGVGNIDQAARMIADGRRFFGRGLVLTASGIKTGPHDFSTIPWTDVEEAEAGDDGLVIKTTGGDALRVSPYADNYVPLVAYLNGMLSEPGEGFDTDELWPQFAE